MFIKLKEKVNERQIEKKKSSPRQGTKMVRLFILFIYFFAVCFRMGFLDVIPIKVKITFEKEKEIHIIKYNIT